MREGFRKLKLGDFTETINGLWTGKKEPFIPVKVYTMSNFTKESDLDKQKEPREVIASLSQYEKRKLKYGDILIEKSGGGPNQPVGRAVFFSITNNENNTFSNFTTRLRIISNHIDEVDSHYLHKYLKFIYMIGETEKFQKNSTNIRNLQLKEYLGLEIPIPPLEEQKQIVAILDKAFTVIDQAKANIEKNIENAKELFQSKLNDIFSNPSTGSGQDSDGWYEKSLKEITTKIGSGATPRGGQASYKESGISLIRSMNVHDDGFREKKLAFIDDKQANKLNNVTIEENDVLLNITGASVARCCVVNNTFLPARVNQHVSIIRLKEGIMNHRFLHYALTSKKTKDLLLGIGEQGATRQAITKVQLENFKIAFPSNIETQNKFVKLFDELRSNTEKIESNYKQKIEDLDELKKSILQKAFAGALTKEKNYGSV